MFVVSGNKLYGFDFSFRFPDENPNTETGTAPVLFNEPYGEQCPDITALMSHSAGILS